MIPAIAVAEDDPIEEDAIEAPAELTDAMPIEPDDPAPVDSEDPDASNTGGVSGTCPGGPPGGTRSLIVIPEDPIIRCPDGSAPVPAVTWTEGRDLFKFRNADGVWWIYKRCIDTTSASLRYTVGPGYVARVSRNGTQLVNDFRGRSNTWSPGLINEVNGGLGTFGWHHARGTAGATPAGDDPTTGAVEVGVGRVPKAIEGRMCPSTNGGSGTYARSWAGPTQVSNSRVDFTMDVWFKERDYSTGFGPGGKAIVRVRYRYSFYRSSVKSWIAVTTYADTVSGAGSAFVKEPKLTALSRGGGFTRLSVMGGVDGNGFLIGMMEGAPEGTTGLSTRHSDHDTRKRVRWDFGNSTAGSEAPGCTLAKPCLNAVMRAYPITAGNVLRGGTTSDWEGSGFGLDEWSVLSDGRSKAYARDTYGDQFVTSCGVDLTASDDTDGVAGFSDAEKSRASERATPSQTNRRRWEVGGWKSGAVEDPYQSAFAFFAGWEDEAGPEDCEPLQRIFGVPGEAFGTFASYSLNDGWTLQ